MKAFAPSTRRTRQSQWNQYFKFCERVDLEPYPVTPKNVCRFLVQVSDSVSYVTLNNYVSALNTLSKLHKDYLDLRQDYGLTLVLRGLKRIKGDCSEPMDPLFPEDLKLCFLQVNWQDPEERIIWIIVLLAFRTLLRKSHFVVDRDETHLLRVGDLSFTDDGCVINITSSKTIQFKERCYKIPVNYAKTPLCVVTLLKDYLRENPKSDTDFLFTTFSDGSFSPIKYSRALKTLQHWSIAAKIPKKVGFHSLRRGCASYMHRLRLPLVSIQQAGDWQSLCVLKYLSCDFYDKQQIEILLSSSL